MPLSSWVTYITYGNQLLLFLIKYDVSMYRDTYDLVEYPDAYELIGTYSTAGQSAG